MATAEEKAQAEKHKASGNAALQSSNPSLAIEHYTSAINLDGSNHVYYSNRSAAYLKQNDATHALQDAESCIGLRPDDFPKGYSRKGAALHALKRYNDSIAAYELGLQKFPEDKGLKAGLESVKKEKDAPPFPTAGAGRGGFGGLGGPANPMMGLFGPDLMAKVAMDPKLRGYLSDPEFVEKLQKLQNDPKNLETMMGDKRILEVFQMLLGGLGMGLKMPGEDGEDEKDTPSPPSASTTDKPTPMDTDDATPTSTTKKDSSTTTSTSATTTSTPTPPEPDLSHLTPDQKSALQAKERGNTLYKSKDFPGALAEYDKAIALDPTTMTYHSNKAAVYFAQKDWQACVDACDTAVEVGKANRAPFQDRAKALVRCAKALHKMDQIGDAIEKLKSAQLEHQDRATDRLLKTWQLEKRKKDALSYQDLAKAEEAKQRGNDHFRAKEWVEAVKEYEEAVKRAPKDAPIRNNLSAALCKIMDFNGAKREIDVALELDPKYVKAWARKGDIEVLMKENHRAMESYKKGLAIDAQNKPCQDGLRKVAAMINAGSANMSEQEKKERAEHALADPEIQAILSDPIIRQILQDFNQNPQAANEAMRDPVVRGKIEKLIASGVVQTG